MILRLGPRASRGIRPPPVYIALRFKRATPSALRDRGSGSPPGSAKLFQVEPGSRPAAPGVSGGARSDDPNRMSRPTPERALPSQVGGAAEAAGARPATAPMRRSLPLACYVHTGLLAGLSQGSRYQGALRWKWTSIAPPHAHAERVP